MIVEQASAEDAQEILDLQKLNEVIHGRAHLAANLDLLQGQDEGLASRLPGGTLGEEATELRIGKLVDAAVGTGAVAPNVRGRLGLDALDAMGSVLVDEGVDGIGGPDIIEAMLTILLLPGRAVGADEAAATAARGLVAAGILRLLDENIRIRPAFTRTRRYRVVQDG